MLCIVCWEFYECGQYNYSFKKNKKKNYEMWIIEDINIFNIFC